MAACADWWGGGVSVMMRVVGIGLVSESREGPRVGSVLCWRSPLANERRSVVVQNVVQAQHRRHSWKLLRGEIKWSSTTHSEGAGEGDGSRGDGYSCGFLQSG
jgi:hypothetical protein